jgi:hypothetical protein
MNITKVINDNYFDVHSIDNYKLVVYPDFVVFGQGKVSFKGKLTFPCNSGILLYKSDALKLLQFLLDIFVSIADKSTNLVLQQTIGNLNILFDKTTSQLSFHEKLILTGDEIVEFAKGFKTIVFKLFGYPMYINVNVYAFLSNNYLEKFYGFQNQVEKICFLKTNLLETEENEIYYLFEVLERHKNLLKQLYALKF